MLSQDYAKAIYGKNCQSCKIFIFYEKKQQKSFSSVRNSVLMQKSQP
jgi:hypothetical protein